MVLQSMKRTTKRIFRQIVATTTSFSLAVAPAIANAQQAPPSIVIDNRTNPSAPAPSLDRTASGVQQLNIATPNGAGLSHNMFTHYGVEQKGLILNNATKATQTQLGGYVYGNANLHGKAAHVILNEVTGTQASHMLGYTEVAGQKANVIVANPNGITCNGCGFINTDRVSLATGHPEIDASGRLSALTVSDGVIAFEGKGGDFTAVPVLDILSRRVTLNARVNAQTARLVVGRSRFDYETGTVHALKSDGSKAPEFAIDSSALGGMYAGQISMIVNEAGAGVRVNGAMAANAGDMTLTSDGRLVLNGSMTSTGNLSVQSGGVQNAGTLQSGADTRLASSADIQNTGTVSAGKGLSVNGSSLTNTGSMTAAGQNGASFTVAGDMHDAGRIGADKGPLTLQASSLTLDAGSTLASTGDMAVNVGQSVNTSGQMITALGKLSLSASSLVNRGVLYGATSTTVQVRQGVTNAAGQIGSGSGLLSITAADLDNGAGKIIAQSGAVSLSTGGIDNRAGVIQGQGDVVVSARTLDNRNGGSVKSLGGSLSLSHGAGPMESVLNQGGTLGTSGSLNLNTNDYQSDASSKLVSTGVLTLVMSGMLDNGGTLSGDKGFNLTVGSFRNEKNAILAAKTGNGQLTVTGNDTLSNDGFIETLEAGTQLVLNTSGNLSNTGAILGSGSVNVSATGGVTNSGKFSALGGDLALDAASLNNSATLAAVGSVSVGLSGDLENTGMLYGAGSVALAVGGAVRNAGIPGAADGTTGEIGSGTGSLSIRASSLDNSAEGAIAAAQGPVQIQARTLTNAAVLQSNAGLSLFADTLVNKSAGQIVSLTGDLKIAGLSGAAVGQVTNAGSLQGQTALALQANALDNTRGTLFAQTGRVDLTVNGALNNTAGIIQSEQDMAIAAASYTSDVASVIHAKQALTATFKDTADNVGHIIADTALALTAGSLTTHTSSVPDDVSVIASTHGPVSITAGSLHNAGVLRAGEDANSGTDTLPAEDASRQTVTITAGSLDNTGVVRATGNLGLTLSGDLTSSGSLVSQKGAATVVAQTLENSGFLGGAQAVHLETQQGLANTGTLFAGTDLTAHSGGTFTDIGGQIGGNTVQLTARGVLDNTSGTVIASAGSLDVTAASLVNTAGILQADQAVTLVADGLDNHQGTILAKTGALSLTSANDNPGMVNNAGGKLEAGTKASLVFSGLDNSAGKLIAFGGELALKGTSTSVVTNTAGSIQSNGALTLNAGRYSAQDAQSRLTAAGSLGMTVANDVRNSGTVASGGNLTLAAASMANDQSGVVSSQGGTLSLDLTGSDGLSNAGAIQSVGAGQALSVNAAALQNTATGHILSGGAQTLTVQGALANAGEITAFGDNKLSMKAASVTNSSQIQTGGSFALTTGGDVTNTGLIYGLGGGSITAATVANAGGQIGAKSGLLTVSGNRIDNSNSGKLVSQTGTLALAAQTVANDNGQIESGSDLSLQTSSLGNQSGTIQSDSGNLVISASNDGAGVSRVDNQSGTIQSANDLTLYAENLDNTNGKIIAKNGSLLLQGDARGTMLQRVVDQNGQLGAAQDLTVRTGSLTGATALTAGRDLTFASSSGITEQFLFSAGRDAAVSLGGAYSVGAGSGVLAQRNVTLEATDITNAGALMAAGGTLTVRTPGGIANTGLIDGAAGLTLALDGALSNIQGALLSDAGSISIGGNSGLYAGAVTNRSGEIMAGSAVGDVTIHAASLTNDILGGVTEDKDANGNPITVVYDSQTYSQGLSGPLPTPSDLPADAAKYYYGQKVIKVLAPAGLLTANGTPASGYFLAALYGGGDSSRVVVVGTGTKVSVNGAPALIDAGRDLTVALQGGLANTGSHIAAGRNMDLSGTTLDNTGYTTSVVYTFSCYNGNSCRYFTPPAGDALPDPWPDMGWDVGKHGAWPWSAHIWGSGQYQVQSSTLVAGENLTATFSGAVRNTNSVSHATAAQIADAIAYAGSVPGGLKDPGNSLNPAGNGSAVLPGGGGQFSNVSTGAGSAQGGAAAVSGGGLSAGGGTTLTGNAGSAGGNAASLPFYGGVVNPEGHEGGAMAAQHLTLPGFNGVTDPTASQIIASIPAGKALYVPNPSPDAHYLIETNPAYTSLTAFHGSEYLLDRLGDQPHDYTFLGDSAFEQQYVQQQIVSATGQTFLGGTYNTASDQMAALLGNAADESQQLGLALGQGLSAAQQSALTSDIVWYVNEEVNGRTALVPKLYLAPGHVALTGASISAKNVSITGGSISNSGSIAGQNSLSLTSTSGDITNTGSLSGGTVSLRAHDGSIITSDTLNSYLVGGGSTQQLASVGTITATGGATLDADHSITFNGGVLTTGGDLNVLAGDGLTLGTTTVRGAASVTGSGLSRSGSQTQNYGTTVAAGGNALLFAIGGDLKASGATVTSGGSTTLFAAKTLDLGAATNSQSSSESGSKHGFLTHSSFSNSQSSSTDVGTTVAAGGALTAQSGGDMHVAGMVGGGGPVSLTTGGSFTEDALHSTASESSSHHVAGLHLSTQGASGTVGYGSRTDAQSASSSTYTPSVIASTGDSLSLNATGPVAINGSVVTAAKNVEISGSSVAFNAVQNSTTQTVTHKDKSIGLTGGVSSDSMVGQAINGAQGAQRSGTGVQSALAGIQTGLGEGMSAVGGATTNNIIGGQASLGFSSHKSRTSETRTTVQGSTAAAGGTLAIEARGDNGSDKNNGTVTATAGHLSGENVVVQAQNGITFQSGVNTDHQESSSSSKTASVGAEASVGTTGKMGVSVTASASASHQHTDSDSTTHVDTTISAANKVSLVTPGTTTLNGAEVSGERVVVKSGMLVITSPQDTAHYNSTSESGGFTLSIPIPAAGLGPLGASGNVASQTVKDSYRSTGKVQSGLYGGDGGLDIDVAGNTSLTAGVISSTADSSRNTFRTGSLDVTGEDNHSTWSGTSVAAGGGFSTAGSLADAAKTATFAVGHVDHSETTTTDSVITGNITVESGETHGSYSTDPATANGHLDNDFNATKVNNALQTQVAAETLAETAVELGVQAYNRWLAPKDRKIEETEGKTLSQQKTEGGTARVYAVQGDADGPDNELTATSGEPTSGYRSEPAPSSGPQVNGQVVRDADADRTGPDPQRGSGGYRSVEYPTVTPDGKPATGVDVYTPRHPVIPGVGNAEAAIQRAAFGSGFTITTSQIMDGAEIVGLGLRFVPHPAAQIVSKGLLTAVELYKLQDLITATPGMVVKSEGSKGKSSGSAGTGSQKVSAGGGSAPASGGEPEEPEEGKSDHTNDSNGIAPRKVGNLAGGPLENGEQVKGRFTIENGPINGTLYRADSKGNITSYATYDSAGRILKRVDVSGAAHNNVSTPHVLDYGRNTLPDGSVRVQTPRGNPRPAEPGEIP